MSSSLASKEGELKLVMDAVPLEVERIKKLITGRIETFTNPFRSPLQRSDYTTGKHDTYHVNSPEDTNAETCL
ncbi:hypothetical protein Q1695_009093 [Nippostrongylus brasiliensis]|nr:hypothetical protein Q1695_009093 [Nippostrongylus brasiliensis]